MSNRPVFKLPPYKVGMMARTLSQPVNYGLQLHNVPYHWSKTEGDGVIVSVIDTGLPTHPDLDESIIDSVCFTNYKHRLIDTLGHSTHVAGIIAGRGGDTGINGIAPKCKLLIAKALDDDGVGQDEWIAKAIDWSVERGAHIINMSLGADASSEQWFTKTRASIQAAAAKGVICVAASGNESSKTVGLPARWPECIAVGAVDRNKWIAPFSNSGPTLDFAAFGVRVMSTFLRKGYAQMSGTSMATPQIAGICALILSDHLAGRHKRTPIRNVDQMIEHLKLIAFDVGPEGFDSEYGWGIPIFGPSYEDVREEPNKLSFGVHRWLFLHNLLRLIGRG